MCKAAARTSGSVLESRISGECLVSSWQSVRFVWGVCGAALENSGAALVRYQEGEGGQWMRVHAPFMSGRAGDPAGCAAEEGTVPPAPLSAAAEAAPANVRIYVTKPHSSVLCSFDCEMFEPYQDEPQSSMQN